MDSRKDDNQNISLELRNERNVVQKETDEVNSVDSDGDFRSSVRNNILKRIYQKNANLPPLKDVLNKPKSDKRDKNNLQKEIDLEEKTKRTNSILTNEWRKTLERVLNYDQGQLDGQLEVSRRDGLCFFVQKNWSQEETQEKKGKRTKKRKESVSKSEPLDWFAKRMPLVPWKQLVDTSKKSSILTYHLKEIQAREAIDSHILHRRSLYQRFLLRSVNSLDTLHEYSYFFRRNESSKVWKFFSFFYEWFMQYNPTSNITLQSLNNKCSISTEKQTQLNNNRFVLRFCDPVVSFWKHPLMAEEHKLIRQLFAAFEGYQKSVSTKTNQRLNRLTDLIEIVWAKAKESLNQSKENNVNEGDLDLDLLKRLVGHRNGLILERRKSLIELIRMWDRVMSNKSTNRFVTSNCINLRLDEVSNLDEEQEKKEFNLLLNQSQQVVKLIEHNEVDLDAVKSNTFLPDGRLPGEPKFNAIELTYEPNKHPNGAKTQSLDLVYYIQVVIGDRCMARFDLTNLMSDFGNLDWNNRSCSVTFPSIALGQRSTDYGPVQRATETTETRPLVNANVDYYEQFLPKILLFEKSLKKGVRFNQDSKLIFEYTISDFPRLYQRSSDNAKHLESDFEYSYSVEQRSSQSTSSHIKGKLKFSFYWSSLPFNVKTELDFSSSNYEFMFDQEKRQIKRLTDLKVIDQTLHDLRYVNTTDWDAIGDNQPESMRRIQLMDLLLRQKYQVEIDVSLEKHRQNPVDSLQNLVVSKEQSDLPDGMFCTDEEIEQNKRFQLLIYRNSNSVRNYQKLRFIPLSNITDVMVKQMMLTERNEKLSIELLLNYVRTTSEEQIRRVNRNLRKKKKRKKSLPESGNKIIHDWCLNAKNAREDNHILVSHIRHWIPTIEEVLNKLELDQQSVAGLNSNENSAEFFTSKRILSFSDIVHEDLVDAFAASDFSLFAPFVGLNRSKLNPSRKDRRKVAITLSDAIDREVQVILSIQHATNVPLKTNESNDETNQNDDDEDDYLDQFSQCSTYVEFKYDNQIISSTISEGSQPTWNENFRFKTKLDPRKFITLNLFEVVKMIRSNSVSSEASSKRSGSKSPHHVATDSESEEERSPSPAMFQEGYLHFEKRYLGQVQIPVSALLFSSKIEGTFQLSSPYFLQNYKNVETSFSQNNKRSRARLLNQSGESETVIRPGMDAKLMATVSAVKSLYSNHSEQTLLGCLPDVGLAFFLTIDPPIEPIPGYGIVPKIDTVESLELIELCRRWRTSLSLQFPHRHYICLVSNLQNTLVLACRFVAPIKPPELTELIHLDQIFLKNDKSDDTSGKRFKMSSLKKLVHKETLHLNLIIRFVSLIPTYADNPPAIGSPLADQCWWSRLSKHGTIWLDMAQFLSFRIGFQVEHALYLCGMLQHLSRTAYLLCGSSSIEGPAGFVILYPNNSMPTSKDDSLAMDYEPIVINPRNGQQFSVHDTNITITSIDCIVTSDNVYANIQRNSHPNSMQFNLYKSNHWHPLLSPKDLTRFASVDELHQHGEQENFPSASTSSSILFSIQPETISYSNTIHTDSAAALEAKLENYLRDQLMAWRRTHAANFTPFNRFCTQIVRRTLPQLEVHSCLVSAVPTKFGGQPPQVTAIEEALLAELQQIATVHHIVGYPLHVSPVTDFDRIASLVYDTGVHSIDALDHNHSSREAAAVGGGQLKPNPIKLVEFILSVYVHPYPTNVYSIWVYVGALLPKM